MKFSILFFIGKKHKQLMEAKRKSLLQMNSFFESSAAALSSTVTSEAKEENTVSTLNSIENFETKNDVLEAEVLWALKCVKSPIHLNLVKTLVNYLE